MRLKIESRPQGPVEVLDLLGDLVMGDECRELVQACEGLVASGRSTVVLNLQQLRFIDSSGVGELLTCFSRIQKAGGALKLAAAEGMVLKVLKLTRTLEVVPSYASEADAISAV